MSDTNVTPLRPAGESAERSRRYRRKRKTTVREPPTPLPAPVTPVTRHGGRGVIVSTTAATHCALYRRNSPRSLAA